MKYLGRNVAINIKNNSHGFLGELVDAEGLFLTIIKKDGRQCTIKKRAVEAIENLDPVYDGDRYGR